MSQIAVLEAERPGTSGALTLVVSLMGVQVGQVTLVLPTDTGFNSIPRKALLMETALPLGGHLLPSMVEKRGYVDIFDLLNRELEVKKTDKELERERGQYRRRMADRCWASWLLAFIIYAVTVIHAQPERALSLLQYKGDL